MDFLIDYLPAIQFAAALNIGYIIPDIMVKINSVLNNINNGYVDVLQEVRSKIVLKSNEVRSICVLQTIDKRTTKGYIDKQLNNLELLKDNCDGKEQTLKTLIDSYVKCAGYRSVFFFAALFSVFELLVIPFCHQHNDVWSLRMFFYVMNSASIVFLMGLFLKVICTRNDMSCRSVFGFFMFIILLSAVAAYINTLLPAVIVVDAVIEKIVSGFSVMVAFLPGAGCMLFLMALVYYAVAVAELYSLQARIQFWKINKATKKLHDIEELFEKEVTVE